MVNINCSHENCSHENCSHYGNYKRRKKIYQTRKLLCLVARPKLLKSLPAFHFTFHSLYIHVPLHDTSTILSDLLPPHVTCPFCYLHSRLHTVSQPTLFSLLFSLISGRPQLEALDETHQSHHLGLASGNKNGGIESLRSGF